MNQFFKKALIMTIALATIAMFISISTELNFYQSFIYIFFTLFVYGWFVYIPYMYLYESIKIKFAANNWIYDMLLGIIISGSIVSLLIVIAGNTQVFPLFSGNRILDIFSFCIGGAVLSILHHFLIQKKQDNGL